MGFDLCGHQGEHWFGFFSWGKLLELAYNHGWQPEGTRRWSRDDVDALDPEWSGDYFSSDYQWVSASDAANLAAALERALPDIPDHDAFAEGGDEPRPPGGVFLADLPGEGRRGVVADRDYCVHAWFSGPGKAVVRDFISYCQKGGFEIG